MGAYILGDPLGCPMQYDASFKVEACLEAPLWINSEVTMSVAAEIMAVCVQLETLCQKELSQHSEGRPYHGVVSSSFETKGLMYWEKMRSLLQSPDPSQPSIQTYLHQTGLGALFPRTTAYIHNPKEPDINTPPADMDDYFKQMASVNQMVTLAAQISADVSKPANHKYLSHQLAVLHQTLGPFKDYKPVADLKKNIEGTFEVFKTALIRHGKEEPRLTTDHAKWLLELTSAVITTASALPSALVSAATAPAYILTQLT